MSYEQNEEDLAEPRPGTERHTTGEKGESIIEADCHHCETEIYCLLTTGPYLGDKIPVSEQHWLHTENDREAWCSPRPIHYRFHAYTLSLTTRGLSSGPFMKGVM